MTAPSAYPPPVAAFLDRLAHTPVRELLAVVEQADGIFVTRALAAAEEVARRSGRYPLVRAAGEEAQRIVDHLRAVALDAGLQRQDVGVFGLLAEWAVTALVVRDLLDPDYFRDLTHAWGELLPHPEAR